MKSCYKRVLLKLSGEFLSEYGKTGISLDCLEFYAVEIEKTLRLGVELGIVIGGGNFFRGTVNSHSVIAKPEGDKMGMLATVMNSIALQEALEKKNIKSCIFSGISIEGIAKKFNRKEVIKSIERKEVVIFSGGTGNPFFTTDTAAVLRACEVEADVILKATNVDGIFSADPEKEKNATKFGFISFEEVIRKDLKIMDITAFSLSRVNKIPIVVFNIGKKNNLLHVLEGKKIGTIVGE